MKYFKITCSNGFLGCDEEFYVSAEDELEAGDMGVDILDGLYSFSEPDDRFLDYDEGDEESYNEALDWYEENLTCYVEEVSHEEYLGNTWELQ